MTAPTKEAQTPPPVPTKGPPTDENGNPWRSYSQMDQYNECGEAYRLARVKKEWQRPAAWFPQGTGVHAAAEAYELSLRTLTPAQAEQVYLDSYIEETNKLLEITPNTDYWFASGPYKGAEDIERRLGLGMAQIERYIQWYAKHPEETPWTTPAGVLAVELPFEVYFGSVPVRGVIDFVNIDGKPRDNKSGNKPGKPAQLGTYAGALEYEYGIKPTEGDFWMGKTGKATIPVDLTEWTPQRLADVYGEADEGIKAERFEPDPEPSKCNFCTVRASCLFSA